jgi:hypothetical protein
VAAQEQESEMKAKLYNGIPKSKLPKTWEAAARQGVRHFYTGKPCNKGHKAPRYTRGSACTECIKEATYAWRDKNREYYLETAKEAARNRRESYPEAVRKYNKAYYHRVTKPKRQAAKKEGK